jgi:hypothetical protein
MTACDPTGHPHLLLTKKYPLRGIVDPDRYVPRKPRPLGRGQGAQYQRELPCREAPPFRAGSFNSVLGEAISGLGKLDAK